MRELLEPLRRKRVWLTFVLVFVLGTIALAVSRQISHGDVRPLRSIAAGFYAGVLAACIVGVLSAVNVDLRSAQIASLSPPDRAAVRRAVARGSLDGLSPELHDPARRYAVSAIAATSEVTAPTLLMTFLTFPAAVADLTRDFEGGRFSWWVFAAGVALMVFAVPRAFRRNGRYLRNARRVAEG